jgi:dihydrofolate reductase
MEAAMRKIIESTLASADGVVGSPPLWAMDYRDEEVTRDALERLSGSDAMLMGRGTYELFAATWPGQTDDFARRINGHRAPLTLVSAKTFSTGVVVLSYQTAGA